MRLVKLIGVIYACMTLSLSVGRSGIGSEATFATVRHIYSAANEIIQVRFFEIFKMCFTISSQRIYRRFLV